MTHRYLPLLMLLGIQAVALTRQLPDRASPVELPTCPHPVAVQDQTRNTPRIVCLGSESTTMHRLGLRLGQSGWPYRPIHAGQQLHVRGFHVEPMPAGLRLTLGLPIDVNRASRQALMVLPRIGPVLAGRIVEDRERHGPFAGVDDLARVRGIGRKTVQRLRALVMAGQPKGTD